MGLLDYIKQLDFMTLPFEFTLKGNRKYRSFFGACLSLLNTILAIFLIFLMGDEMIYQTNPKVVLHREIDQDRALSLILNNTNFYFAFAIVDSKNNPVDLPEFSFNVTHYTIDTDPETAIITNEVQKPINFKNCFRNSYENAVPGVAHTMWSFHAVRSFLCPNFEQNIEVGGYFDTAKTRYLKITTHIKDGSNIENDLRSRLSKERFFLKYFSQKYNVNPSDLEPFHTYFTVDSIEIDLNTKKTGNLFYNLGSYNFDNGWILDSMNNIEKVGVKYVTFETGSRSGKVINEINLFFPKEVDNYEVFYKKIFEILALVGGFTSISTLATRWVISIYNQYFIPVDFVHEVFDFSEPVKLNNAERRSMEVSEKNDLEKEKTERYLKNFAIKSDEDVLHELQNIKHKKEDGKNYSVHKVKMYTKPLQADGFDILCKAICCRKYTGARQEDTELLKLGQSIIANQFDVSTVLKNAFEQQQLKYILLNRKQYLALEFLKKPNLRKETDLFTTKFLSMRDCEKENKALVKTYFADRFESEELTEIDKRIFENIDLE